MVKLKHIADRCNVSIATVSRVLKNDLTFRVTKETRDLVIETAIELDYKKTTDTSVVNIHVGIVQWISSDKEASDPYYREIRESIVTQCYLNNLKVSQYYKESFSIMTNNRNLNALICIGKFSKKQLKSFAEITTNIYFVDSNPDEKRYSSILHDLEYGTTLALSYLTEMGHKNIGFIGGKEFLGPENILYKDARENFFLEATNKDEISTKTTYIYKKNYSSQTGHDGIEAIYFKNDEMPTAILCASDLIALGALSACSKLGLHEISIISFNNMEGSKHFNPPLTTVELNTELLAIFAVSNLINLHRQGKSNPIKTLIKPKLIIRESVKQHLY